VNSQPTFERSRRIWEAEKPYLSSGITALTRSLPVSFERGDNDVLWDADGGRYVDWSGGTLTSSTGHANPRVAEAVKRQLDLLWNIHDHPSETRARVMRRLDERMPSSGYAFQFYTTGSETVEAALRAALSAVNVRRRRVASFREGYHGKTRGSLMAVHALFGRNATPAHLAPLALPFPACYRCPYDKERRTCELHCARTHADALEADKTVGVFVFEPILGTGGVYGPPEGYWDVVGAACRRLGILLVADEVSTGTFRTGTFLATERFGVEPDLIAFAKGLGSGFPTMALAGRQDLLRDPRVFDHGAPPPGAPRHAEDFRAPGSSSSTFGGNPLALAAIDATLDEFERLEIAKHVEAVGRLLHDGLVEIAQDCRAIGDVRGYGLMLGVELVRDRQTKQPATELAEELYTSCAAAGLLIKIDHRAIVHVTPPLTHTFEHAAEALSLFRECLARLDPSGVQHGQ
jgi:4-aminobutyrate aminotransferase/(S)-3-amino-2-methylpropionate transaminase